MKTLYYNLHGHEQNKAAEHVETGQERGKKVRDFFFKNGSMRAFLHGIEKRDESKILQQFKTLDFENDELVVRRNTFDRAVLFVAGGELVAMQGDENVVYSEGAIIGVDQFLFGTEWKDDIYCTQQATLLKFKYEALMNLVN